MITPEKIHSVLLIDDDNATNFVNSKLFESLDIAEKIIVKDDARDAVEYIKNCISSGEQVPQLIVLDIHMPELDGEHFLGILNKLNLPDKEKVKIVILSDSTHPTHKRIFYDLDVQYYINKPLDKEKLYNILR